MMHLDVIANIIMWCSTRQLIGSFMTAELMTDWTQDWEEWLLNVVSISHLNYKSSTYIKGTRTFIISSLYQQRTQCITKKEFLFRNILESQRWNLYWHSRWTTIKSSRPIHNLKSTPKKRSRRILILQI